MRVNSVFWTRSLPAIHPVLAVEGSSLVHETRVHYRFIPAWPRILKVSYVATTNVCSSGKTHRAIIIIMILLILQRNTMFNRLCGTLINITSWLYWSLLTMMRCLVPFDKPVFEKGQGAKSPLCSGFFPGWQKNCPSLFIGCLVTSDDFNSLATEAKNPRLTPGPDPSSPSNFTRILT